MIQQNRQCSSSSVACPMMECCHGDDTSPDYLTVGLPPCWVDPDVSRLYTSIPGGTWAPRGLHQWLGGQSNAMTWIYSCQMRWNCLIWMRRKLKGNQQSPWQWRVVYGIGKILQSDHVPNPARAFVTVQCCKVLSKFKGFQNLFVYLFWTVEVVFHLRGQCDDWSVTVICNWSVITLAS